jgi:hypothetical protein
MGGSQRIGEIERRSEQELWVLAYQPTHTHGGTMSQKKPDGVDAVIRAAVSCAKAISQGVATTQTHPLRAQLREMRRSLPGRVRWAAWSSDKLIERAQALTDILVMCPAAARGWRQVMTELKEMRTWGDYDNVEYVVEDILWYPYDLGAYFNSDHLKAVVELACLRLYEMRLPLEDAQSKSAS